MAQGPKSGVEALRASKSVEAPDMAGEGPSPERRPPALAVPSPVTPLGVTGKNIVFLDRLRQITVAPAKADKGDLKLWFGNDWLETHYPQKDSKGNVVKFNQDTVQTALIEDCHAKGIFNPQGKVFGRGAHRSRDNEDQLVLHLGERVMIAGRGLLDRRGKPTDVPQFYPAGIVGESYFPALPALPRPADEAATELDARALLSTIGKWYWVDTAASPLLLLGFIAQMFICGALGWRTHVWLAGPTAAGKTSLQKIIRAIHGDWCLHTEDASEAALRQVLRDDTLPVLIDEAEADDNPEKQRAIKNLMKKSSSGAKMYRGGQDHKATEFTAQSCFLLSSVLHVSMKGEDRNRICILDMRAVPEGTDPLELELAAWKALGRKFHRRMIEQWPRFDATFDHYKRRIAKERYEGRWGDTYGTLLACADLLLFDYAVDDMAPDSPGPERVVEAVNRVLPMMSRGRVEARTDVERCQQMLLSHMLPGAHGRPPESVGSWLTRAMELRTLPGAFETDPDTTEIDVEARAKLKSYGLRVVAIARKPGGGWQIEDARPGDWQGCFLAVAYATNKALGEVFRGSEWADGGWLQSLGKIPGVEKGLKVRFAGPKPDNALAVPLAAIVGDEG